MTITHLENEMFMDTLKNNFPKTYSYIAEIGEKEGYRRAGHHRYVIQRELIDNYPYVADMSIEQKNKCDIENMNYLRYLDGEIDQYELADGNMTV